MVKEIEMIEDLAQVTPGNVRLIKSLYNNILGMFEVFNSVQIKPFCLKIGINDTTKYFQSLRIS